MRFTHAQLDTVPSATGNPLPAKDTGPYELITANGLPEAGNFEASFRTNDGTVYHMDDTNENPTTVYTPDEIETLGSCLVHINALTNLLNQGKTQEEAEQIVSDWWSLEGDWTMKNGHIIPFTDEYPDTPEDIARQM